MQHSCGKGADRRNQSLILSHGAKIVAKSSKVGEGVLQQSIVTLELLDQFLLLVDQGSQSSNAGNHLCVRRGRLSQATKRVIECTGLSNQRVILAQHARTGAEHVSVQPGLYACEVIEYTKRSIEPLSVRISGMKGQPRQQNKQERHPHSHGGCPPHRGAMRTGAARYMPVKV